jgi:hypothetical protein
LKLGALGFRLSSCHLCRLQPVGNTLLAGLQHVDHGLEEKAPQDDQQNEEVEDLRYQEWAVDSQAT